MADIRPFRRADLPAVLALLQRHMQGWKVDARLFAALVFDHPWADEELPSLVAVRPGGEIVGFTGVQVRRMRLDDRAIRGVHSGHGVVKPESRGGAVGALLIGRALSGPQEITWSDGTADSVAAVFRTFGGQIDHVRTCDWLLVLRTTRWLRSLIVAATRPHHVSRRENPVPALPFQAAGHRIFPTAFPEPAVGVIGEHATAATIVEHLPALNKRRRLWVEYDEEYLDHLFDLVRSFHGLESFRGPLFTRLVRRNDHPIGWYAYVARRGGASRVLHLCSLERETDAVLGELIDHARSEGSAALAGRSEPHLQKALTTRFAVLGFAGQATVLAKDPEVAGVIATSSSLVTRLDGDLLWV